MDILTRKINLIESFLHLQNDAIITKIENILKKEDKLLSVGSLLQYNDELDNANNRIENGSFYKHEDVEKIVLEWK